MGTTCSIDGGGAGYRMHAESIHGLVVSAQANQALLLVGVRELVRDLYIGWSLQDIVQIRMQNALIERVT